MIDLVHPSVPVPGVPKRNVFHALDNSGLKCGSATVVEFVNEALVPERPLNYYVNISALDPRAFDMLLGAVMARAFDMRRYHPDLPGRIYVPCRPEDRDLLGALTSVGFQNDDSEIRMRKLLTEDNSDANPPVGCEIRPLLLDTSGDVNGLLQRVNTYSLTNHAPAWVDRLRQEQLFVVFGVWQDSTLLGEIVLTAYGSEGHIEMIYTRPEFRSRGVATALIAHAGRVLLEGGIRLLYSEVWQRNERAVRLAQATDFEFISPIILYPGVDLD